MKTRNERLKELLKNNYLLNEWMDIDSVLNIEYYDEINNIEDLQERVEQRINEHDIIYYFEAMKFLSEHDQSLCNSLEIASELGYKTEDLNSELLSTLLLQSMLIGQLSEVIEEIEKQNIFND